MNIRIGSLAALLLAACAGASLAPAGWQKVPGNGSAWTTGSGPTLQEYVYRKYAFSGGLQDLASQVTIDALLHNGGAKLSGGVPFAACPGTAGLQTFRLRPGLTLQEGFAVVTGNAIRVRYIRPAGTPVDSNVATAMTNALCVRP